MEGQALVISTIICVLFCNTGDLCSAAHNGSVVNIGVLLNQNTRVGKVAKIAMEMAEDDVNRDTQLLNGARLVLHFRDTQGDPIVGASHGKFHLRFSSSLYFLYMKMRNISNLFL